jgi:DNA-binding CsgD family transcriptional regulator/tetratricopeptide (TPR) repeat protein
LSGDPSLCLVGGEAGVGKSRLIRELEGCARGLGALVLRGECADLVGDELPYAPLIAALRGAPGRVESALGAMPDAVHRELGRLLPSVGYRVSEETIGGLAQTRLFELLLTLLRELARDDGLVLVVEDVHWSDSSTRNFLSHFVRNMSTERVGVVVSWRTDVPEGDRGALQEHIGELQRLDRVDCMLLSRLSREELREQLEHILGHPPDARLLDDLCARSDGNPFYAEELLAAGGSDALPEHLRDLLLVRVRQLPDEVQDLMRALAAFGRPASQELLGEVAEVAEPVLSRRLRMAAARHVLSPTSGELLAFRHALVREAVYCDMLPGERRGLHLAIAQTMTRQEEPPDPAELANHWRRARRWSEARLASVEAGRVAMTMRAFEEALGHFDRALEQWAGSDGRVAGMDRVDVLGQAAEAARYQGDCELGVRFCRRALAELDADSEPVRAAWFHERIGRYQFWDYQTSLPAYREALRLLPDEPRADRARVLGDEGLALMGMVRWEEARARCEEAISVARAVGAPLEEAYARTTLGLVLAYLGATGEGQEQLERALEITEARECAEDLARIHIHLSEVLRLEGRLVDAFRVAEEGVREARRLGVLGSFGRSMAANATEDLFRLGRWDEAERRLDELASVPLTTVGALMRDAVSGHLAAARGEFAAARRYFDAARVQGERGVPPEFLPTIGTGLAATALGRGRVEEARDHVEHALAGIPDTEERLYTPMLLAMAARVQADLAEAGGVNRRGGGVHADRAEALVNALEQRLAGVPLGPPPPIALAHLAECRAEAARAAGRPSTGQWEACAERWNELECPYPEAYARFRMAEATLLAGGPRSRAAPPLRTAGRIASGLGARPLLDEIETLARRGRVDLEQPDSLPPVVPDPAFDLTRRELEVLPLVADGLTNQQIADELFISPHTVGVHVSHILAKLDADNRVAAAAAAHRAGLLSDLRPEQPEPERLRESDPARSVPL